jgi:5-methylcytosine-specific restriction endonuclease McrA
MPCGKDLAEDCEYDHIKRCEIEPDNSLENCRPLCRVHHAIKTAKDAKEAAKGRATRRETKKSQAKDAMRGKHFQKGAKINSRNTLSKEHREEMKAWKEMKCR